MGRPLESNERKGGLLHCYITTFLTLLFIFMQSYHDRPANFFQFCNIFFINFVKFPSEDSLLLFKFSSLALRLLLSLYGHVRLMGQSASTQQIGGASISPISLKFAQ
jgi:hypothetical protein